MRSITWIVAMTLFGLGVAAGALAQGPNRRTDVIRVVAIDDRFDLTDYASYATFEDEMRRLFDLARPHLVDDQPNLVVRSR